MPLNLGYVELGGGGVNGGVWVRIYYDDTFVPGVGQSSDDAPLINGDPARGNGGRGWCLDMTNTSGRNARLSINGLSDTPVTITVGQGDPVNSGPANGRSRTAAQMAALGFTTRGNLGQVSVSQE